VARSHDRVLRLDGRLHRELGRAEPFTPVPDAGDAVCIRARATAATEPHWEVSIPVTTVQSVLPQIGSLQSIAITGRNGYGDWGDA